MAQKKTFRVSLDMKAPTAQRNEWEVVEGDNGNVLEITLTDDGEPVDLTGCLVLAVFGLPTGQTVEQDTDEGSVTIGGTDNNVITIALKTGSFSPGKSASGLMKCEIQVYSGISPDLTLITSAQFTFRCRRAIMNSETIQATDEYPVLVELIEQVQQLMVTNQSDWDETDPVDPAYIKNKPASMTPSAHASTHQIGGTDALPAASTSQAGLVQLYDGVDSTDTAKAATPNAVKTAYDEAAGKYSLPSGGIPATDLASAVQTSLGKADTALQSDYLLVRALTVENVSLSSGAYQTDSLSTTYSGYTACGLVGFRAMNSSSGGANQTQVMFSRAHVFLDDRKVYYSVRNVGSSAAKVDLVFYVLYRKN